MMETVLQKLFDCDKSESNFSFQLVVWDNDNTNNWEDEFVFYSEQMKDLDTAREVTYRLVRFLDDFKTKPLSKGIKKKKPAKKDEGKKVLCIKKPPTKEKVRKEVERLNKIIVNK